MDIKPESTSHACLDALLLDTLSYIYEYTIYMEVEVFGIGISIDNGAGKKLVLVKTWCW